MRIRIRIISDLHIELEGNLIPPLAPEAELAILAGDLAPVHTRKVGDIARRWAGADRILYVPGNHEFNGSDIEVGRRELARQCLEHGVTLVDPGDVTVEHVRFIGATLWTDFLLEGVAGEAWAHLEVGQGLLFDFTGAIRHHGGPDGRFTTRESARRHAERAGRSSRRNSRRQNGPGSRPSLSPTTHRVRGASGPGTRIVA